MQERKTASPAHSVVLIPGFPAKPSQGMFLNVKSVTATLN